MFFNDNYIKLQLKKWINQSNGDGKEILLSSFVRIVTIGAKTALSLSIISLLSPQEIVCYAILGAQIAFLSPFLGLEFSNYAYRQMLGDRVELRSYYICNMVAFLAASTVFITLALYIGSSIIGYSPALAGLIFWILLILDNWCQEIVKLHSNLKHAKEVALISFMRYGIWVAPLILYLNLSARSQNATTIAIFWAAGTALGVLAGVLMLNSKEYGEYTRGKLDVNWMKQGISVGFVYLMVNSLTRLPIIADKIVLEKYVAEVALASYIIYNSISMAWRSLLDTSIIIKRTPTIVTMVRNHQLTDAWIAAKKLVGLLWSAQLLGLLFTAPVAYILLKTYDKVGYLDYYVLLPVFFILQATIQASNVLHSIVYAHGCDSTIFIIQAASVLVFLVSLMAFIQWLGIWAAIIAVFLCYFVQLIAKLTLILNLSNQGRSL